MTKHKSVFNGQLYLGFVFIVAGGLFLADMFLFEGILRFYWPLLIVLFGVTFFVGMLVAGKSGAALAIPGTIITFVGLLLFLQNALSLWVTWIYAWTLLISAVGLGMLIMNFYLKQQGIRRVAGLLIGIGLTLFVVLGVFIEIILGITGVNVNSGVILGSGLVLLGVFIIFSKPLFAKVNKRSASTKKESNEVVDAAMREVVDLPGESGVVVKPLAEDVEFSRLHFKSIGEVQIIQGDTCELRMEGNEELLKKVKVDVKNDILAITYMSDVADWTGFIWITAEHRICYYLTVKDISQIDMAGAGSIRTEKLEGKNLQLAHAGVGQMILKGLNYQELLVDLGGLGEIRVEGEVDSQSVDLSGGGSYQAENLLSQSANISLSGAGSGRVWVDGELNVDISGAGSVKYKGSPSISQNITGLGSIKPL